MSWAKHLSISCWTEVIETEGAYSKWSGEQTYQIRLLECISIKKILTSTPWKKTNGFEIFSRTLIQTSAHLQTFCLSDSSLCVRESSSRSTSNSFWSASDCVHFLVVLWCVNTFQDKKDTPLYPGGRTATHEDCNRINNGGATPP